MKKFLIITLLLWASAAWGQEPCEFGDVRLMKYHVFNSEFEATIRDPVYQYMRGA
jgi:hypothetical protein